MNENYFVFLIKSAIVDFSRNKGRTFLTSLGILIGVMAVVLLTAFGLGLKKYIDKVFVYDKTNDDGDYGAEMESQGTSLMREILAKITKWKKQYDENVKNNNKKI